jgi:hypothetical protein
MRRGVYFLNAALKIGLQHFFSGRTAGGLVLSTKIGIPCAIGPN